MDSKGHSGLTRNKAIPEHRDRLQSQVLVAVAGTLLALSCVCLAFATGRSGDFNIAFAVAIFFAVLVWLLRAATVQAALWGGVICLLITAYPSSAGTGLLYTGLPVLVTLFLLTFAATRIARARGVPTDATEVRRGRRASQVIANLGWAGLVVALPLVSSRFNNTIVGVLLTAVLAEATADTVSSEIGQAWGGTPFLLGSWRRVEPGIDGAITIVGTLAGMAGALLVMLVAKSTLQLPWKLAILSWIAATAGLFFDTILGATVERKGFLGNDLVNFTSNGFSATLAALLLLLCA